MSVSGKMTHPIVYVSKTPNPVSVETPGNKSDGVISMFKVDILTPLFFLCWETHFVRGFGKDFME